jgi:hypothetical protein
MHVLKADDGDPDPIAICCYGMLRNDTKKVMLRFAEGRPIGEVTALFLEWVCQMLHEEGKKRLIVIWDDAPWHACMTVLDWAKKHNCSVKLEGGVEIIHFELPVRSPWLNNIEPCYMWAKERSRNQTVSCRHRRLWIEFASTSRALFSLTLKGSRSQRTKSDHERLPRDGS